MLVSGTYVFSPDDPDPDQLSFGKTLILAGALQAPAQALGLRAVAQEAEDRRPEANVGRDTALLPSAEGGGAAAKHTGRLLLPDAAVEPGSLQVLAHCPGVCGVAGAGNPATKGQ
jgi:hypothetical protein